MDTSSRQSVAGASVLIPVRNGAHHLQRQLAALSRQDYMARWEVVVIDDASTDDSGGIAHRCASWFDSLSVVRLPHPSGIGAARNAGRDAAATSRLVYCDADDAAAGSWLRHMAEALDLSPLAGGQLELECINDEETLRYRGRERRVATLPATMGFLPYAVGASLGVRSETFDELGGFDDRLVGHEDVDFCWRAQFAGHHVGPASGAIMHYRVRETHRELWHQRYAYGLAYAQLYNKHRSRLNESGRLSKNVAASASVLAASPRCLRRKTRGRWIYDAAWTVGRFVGSARNRTLCPT